MNKLTSYIVLFSFLLVTACGGDGGSDGGDTPTSNGTAIVIGNVSGLSYTSESYSGTTNANGEFQYKEGETVTFSIDDLEIGSITAITGGVTASGLVGESVEAPTTTTSNLQSLLLALDSDSDPSNGITIDTTGYQLTGVDLTNSASISSALNGQVLDTTAANNYFAQAYEQYSIEITNVASYNAYSSFFHEDTSTGTCAKYTGATIDILESQEGKRIQGMLNLSGGGTDTIDELRTSIEGTTQSGRKYKFSTAYYGGKVGGLSIYDGTSDNRVCQTSMRLTQDGSVNLEPLISDNTYAQTDSVITPSSCYTSELLNGGTAILTGYFRIKESIQDPDGFLQAAELKVYKNGALNNTVNLLAEIPYSSSNPPSLYNQIKVSLG